MKCFDTCQPDTLYTDIPEGERKLYSDRLNIASKTRALEQFILTRLANVSHVQTIFFFLVRMGESGGRISGGVSVY